MRLGIDAREIQDGVYTGIGRALANFLHYYSLRAGTDTCVLFSSRKIPLDYGPKVSNVVMPQWQTLVWDQVQLPWALNRERVDLFYSPYYKVPLLKPCAMVSAILDLMYLVFKPYRDQMPVWGRLYYMTFGRWYIGRADKVLTCSEHSKQDIARLYGVREDKIISIPLSVADIYRPEKDQHKIAAMKERYGIQDRYLLYMGNFKAHKNVATLVHAFAQLAPLFPDLNLVLAGPKDQGYGELLRMAQEARLQERIIFTGKVVEEDEPRLLYSGAEAFVMPTLYEGFGLPLIEAMACGLAVISSNTTSVPEVVADAGLLVDPHSPADLAGAIKRVLQDPVLKQDLIAKGQARVEQYNAAAIAGQIYDLFNNVFKEDQKNKAKIKSGTLNGNRKRSPPAPV